MGRYAFFQGQVVPLEQANVSVMTHAFNYGTACFEGIRAYWSQAESQLFCFRLREHFERIHRSCRLLRIEPRYSVDQLCAITLDVLQRNNDHEDMYIRPVFYKSTAAIGVKLVGIDDDFTMFAAPMGPYLDLEKGLRVRISSWRHVDDNAIPMRGKITGAYVNAALAKTEALDDGYDEAIFLTNDGHVSEGSAENVFIIRNGALITPPVTADILEGVTRATVMGLVADEIGLLVIEREIDRTELYIADEAFFVGTGAQVSPISEVDHRRIGNGGIGPISRTIQELYFRVVRGEIPRYRHWCTPVY